MHITIDGVQYVKKPAIHKDSCHRCVGRKNDTLCGKLPNCTRAWWEVAKRKRGIRRHV